MLSHSTHCPKYDPASLESMWALSKNLYREDKN